MTADVLAEPLEGRGSVKAILKRVKRSASLDSGKPPGKRVEKKRGPLLLFANLLVMMSLVLAACGATPVSGAETPRETAPIVVTMDNPSEEPPAPTPTPTQIVPEATATPDIENMPLEQVAQLIAEGQVEYPADWDDEKKHDLALVFAEYINERTANEAYVPMHFDEVGDIRVGWNPVTREWLSDHNTPEGSLDFSGDSFPELVVPGYTNAADQEVIIDPETEDERIVSTINMPVLGERSITQLYNLGQTQLTNYAVELMLGANGINDPAKSEIESYRNNHFTLPVVLSESALQNDPIYSDMHVGGVQAPLSIPEVPRDFWKLPTNGVLMPIFDKVSGEVISWIRIEQGIKTPRNHSFPFTPGQNPSWVYTSNQDAQIFGNNQNHDFALLFSGKTTADSYILQSSAPFLENGIGIGDAEDVIRILNSNSTEELVRLLIELRIITLYPGIEIHQQ